ncbi:MAG TPA: DUF692 domain-containing protein [Hyphomonadaceae bacterium]|nr:DUF692 domain-containing protein [Hyphomonadaceae bacterium]
MIPLASPPPLPQRAGIGLKPDHYRAILDSAAEGLWLEAHPENYMVDGGPRLAWLEALRERHPLSFHGVGASLGGPDPIDSDHLGALKSLIARFEPAVVSEHVAWSAAGGRYFADLFPLPRTDEALCWLAERIDAFQMALRRAILIENPSVYLPLKSEMDEPDFLVELCKRTGCGLLLDVNNVFVSANNTGFDAAAYIDAIPGHLVGEVHLAGHEADARRGANLLIDTHGAPVAEPVWALYERLISRIGSRPTLIERDANIPAFDTLMAERGRADLALARQLEAA